MSMRQVEVSPSRPIRSQRSTSSLQLRGKYVAGACARCKQLKMRCNVERGGTSCRRCIDSGHACTFPGRKATRRFSGGISAHPNHSRSSRSRSRSTDSASSRNDVRLTLSPLDESDEEEENIIQRAIKRTSLVEYPPAQTSEPLGPQVCIACGACEMVDDGWMIPQHFGVKTYVPIALSLLCPICGSNSHEFRGRLPRPSTAQPSNDWVRAAITSYDVTLRPTSPPATDTKPPPYSLPASASGSSLPAAVLDPAASPQAANSSEKVHDWKAIPWSTTTLLAWSTRTFHLLTMLWIPRYYENQIRHGVLKLGDPPEVDINLHASRSADDMTLERTEGGRNNIETEDEEAAMKIRVLWLDFVESRVFEWNILISITLVLIAASPTIFQIPSASNDRLIRTLTFLSISRAISGLTFGIILSLHFRSPLTRSVAYVQSWFLESRKTNLSLFKFWIIVSLPASSTVWSLILFVSAIFGLVWRTDALHDEEQGPVLARRTSAMILKAEHSYISILRSSITILFLIDIAYAIWALIFLQRRTRSCLERQVNI